MTPPLRDTLERLSPALTETLQMVFWQNTFTTKAIEQTIKHHPDWGNDTRAVFSETVYDLIRWWRPLWFLLNTEPSSAPEDLQRLILIYLF